MSDEDRPGRQPAGQRFFDGVDNKLTASTDIVTPHGTVRLCWRDEALYNVVLGPYTPEERRSTVRRFLPSHPAGQQVVAGFLRYFGGQAVSFDVPLPEGVGNDLQRTVWEALAAIPHGTCQTHTQLAERLGLPAGQSRLLANAAAQNPLPIIYPCHRLVSPNGSLTGYSAGVHWRRALLELEGVPVQHERVRISGQ
ncbi:MAG: methylated-DNA--[protein]-cysteine S-methyltransferase [Gemmatimonadota bacterium]